MDKMHRKYFTPIEDLKFEAARPKAGRSGRRSMRNGWVQVEEDIEDILGRIYPRKKWVKKPAAEAG